MIHDTNELMDFEKQITFLSPKSISSGNYLIKCFHTNQTPLFIQSPKCISKQGIVKAGKKLYCDLVFSYDDEFFLRWIEQFESFCQNKIFENRSTWFDSELEIHDIENSFLPSLKIFKSGKQHILRTNIPLRLGKCSLKIYDENEDDVDPDKIIENTKIMTIIEIQGIKCSSRSFQIEYEIKQMMLLNPVDIFEKCLFPIKKRNDEISIQKNDLGKLKQEIESINVIQTDLEDIKNDNTELTLDLGNRNEIEPSLFLKNEYLEEEQNDLAKISKTIDTDLCEIDLVMPENNEEDILKLKNRNAVYFEMYREAKRKAKLARDFALSAYLEAKRIKNTYLMDETFVSDDENDLEEKSLENVF